jgi:hypothetical protein
VSARHGVLLRATLGWIAIVAMPSGAAAQAQGAAAEQLFRDGKRLMKEGKIADACDAFAESQKLEPSSGTLMNLAACREKNGQIASAWGLFLEVERTTRADAASAALGAKAKERAVAIEPRLSYLTISVPKESDIDGLAIARNDTVIGEGSWNRAIPVDGGTYVITGHAPGHEPWSTTVQIANEKGRVSVDVPRFKEVAKLVGANAGDDGDGGGGEGAPSGFTGKRKAAIGIGAVSVVALGAGIALGLQAKDYETQANDLCPTASCGPNAAEGNDLGDKARQRALFANIGYGTATVAIGAATVLWLTGAPRRATVSPTVSATSARLDVMVRF